MLRPTRRRLRRRGAVVALRKAPSHSTDARAKEREELLLGVQPTRRVVAVDSALLGRVGLGGRESGGGCGRLGALERSVRRRRARSAVAHRVEPADERPRGVAAVAARRDPTPHLLGGDVARGERLSGRGGVVTRGSDSGSRRKAGGCRRRAGGRRGRWVSTGQRRRRGPDKSTVEGATVAGGCAPLVGGAPELAGAVRWCGGIPARPVVVTPGAAAAREASWGAAAASWAWEGAGQSQPAEGLESGGRAANKSPAPAGMRFS